MAGRGFGKTRTGAEYVRFRVDTGCRQIGLVGPTAADTRDIMVRGESGLLSIYPPNETPVYQPSNRRVTWPNGAEALLFSADEPERLRGQNIQAAWCDEIGSWRYPEAFDQLLLGMRSGADPRVVVTTTPRPTKLIRELIAEPNTIVTRGSSYENRGNLAAAFFEQIIRKYEGTRLGRQEIEAELLEDVPGALWTRALLEAARPPIGYRAPDFTRVVVAIDPAATSGEDADETGIIVVARDTDGRGYVLADLSGHMTPIQWAKAAIAAYQAHKADRIVAEVNNGGEMVENTLRIARRADAELRHIRSHAIEGCCDCGAKAGAGGVSAAIRRRLNRVCC
jgi:phage terminase large subunit-like protein